MRKIIINTINLICSLLIFSIFLAVNSFAGMAMMSDDQLDSITGEGFTEFQYQDRASYDIARTTADFNINVKTYTEIESVKMGYYDNGDQNGWDQAWSNVSIGTESQDFVMNGLFFEAEFSHPDDPSTRQLNFFQMGFRKVTGEISGNFHSLTSNLHGDPRQDLGQATITMDNSQMAIVLDAEKGFFVDFGTGVSVK